MNGAIFMCNKQTRHECFRFRVFGLPASKSAFVRQIKKGAFLFLFDTDGRKLYGVYEAVSDGGLDFEPRAFGRTGTYFPAQVRFKILWKCAYLSEDEFKPAIISNYYSHNKFNPGLDRDQVRNLLSLFEPRRITAQNSLKSRSPRTSSSTSHSPRTSSRLGSNPQHESDLHSKPYQYQPSDFDNRRLSLSSNPNPSSHRDPYQFQSSNYDNKHHGSNSNPNPSSHRDPYQLQTSNYDNNRHSSNPNPSSNPDILMPQQYYSTCAGPYQSQYQTDTGTVPDLKCETGSNQDHTKPHPFCDYCALKNNGTFASSSQPVQFYTPNPESYSNVTRGVEASNPVEESQHDGNNCNQVPENFFASVFERLQKMPNAHVNPNFVSEGSNPNPNPVLYSDSERPSVFSRLAGKAQKEKEPKQTDEGPTLDQLLYSLNEKSNKWAGQRKEKSTSNKWVRDKTIKSVVEPVEKPSTEIEAKEDLGSDRMEIDVNLTEPCLENFEFDESQIPFLNFKRRSGERKTNVESEEGSKKKRRFVRPSLEIEGPMVKFDVSFDEPIKETETQEKNAEEKVEPTLHEFDGKSEEKIGITDFTETGSKRQNQDLQGPFCKNGLSKETEMDCEKLGLTTAQPQEEGEIIFSPLLQFNVENKTEQLENVGPTQIETFSCHDGKTVTIEKYPTLNEDSKTEKNEFEGKNDTVNLNAIDLVTQNLMETTGNGNSVELGEQIEEKNNTKNLSAIELATQNLMEISPTKENSGEIAESELGEKKIEEKKDSTDSQSDLPKEETEPKSSIPKQETEPKFSIPTEETEPKSSIPKHETEPKPSIPKEETEPKSSIPKDETEPKSRISKEETEPKSGNSKPGLGFDIRSLIRKAKPENLNEAGTCKDQEEILNEDFIALD